MVTISQWLVIWMGRGGGGYDWEAHRLLIPGTHSGHTSMRTPNTKEKSLLKPCDISSKQNKNTRQGWVHVRCGGISKRQQAFFRGLSERLEVGHTYVDLSIWYKLHGKGARGDLADAAARPLKLQASQLAIQRVVDVNMSAGDAPLRQLTFLCFVSVLSFAAPVFCQCISAPPSFQEQSFRNWRKKWPNVTGPLANGHGESRNMSTPLKQW